jgi:hypothetical protein
MELSNKSQAKSWPEKCLVFKKGRGYISADDFATLLA